MMAAFASHRMLTERPWFCKENVFIFFHNLQAKKLERTGSHLRLPVPSQMTDSAFLRKKVAASRQAACRVRTHDVDRVRTAARTGRVGLDVRWSKVCRRNGCARIKLRFHRILLLRGVDLLKVSDTRILAAGL